jgi:hypothetical protein
MLSLVPLRTPVEFFELGRSDDAVVPQGELADRMETPGLSELDTCLPLGHRIRGGWIRKDAYGDLDIPVQDEMTDSSTNFAARVCSHCRASGGSLAVIVG